jgi:hypothetical protein
MNIVLHIERLVLQDLPVSRADHEALKHAVAAELTTLLAGGVHPDLLSGGARPALTGGRIDLAPGATPSQLGGQVARAVHGGIGAV